MRRNAPRGALITGGGRDIGRAAASMPFRAVVFDLFGTLVEVLPLESYRAMVERMADAVGAAGSGFFDAWFRTRPERLVGKFSSLEDNIRFVLEELGLQARDEGVQEAVRINESFVLGMLENLKPDALDTARAIRGRDLLLALMSDCYQTAAEGWFETPLAPHFNAAVFSCREGARKPDPRLYERVCRKLRVEPSECLYVGDGGGNELEGAAAVGMTPVLVENDVSDPFVGEAAPSGAVHTVRRLSEIPALLGGRLLDTPRALR